jgi:hypothetical protein
MSYRSSLLRQRAEFVVLAAIWVSATADQPFRVVTIALLISLFSFPFSPFFLLYLLDFVCF